MSYSRDGSFYIAHVESVAIVDETVPSSAIVCQF